MRLVFVPGVDQRALPLLPASSAAHKASVFERTASALAAMLAERAAQPIRAATGTENCCLR